LDVGTTGCKAIAINKEGEILSRATGQYPLVYSHTGWAELNPNEVWKEIKLLLHQVSAEVNNDPIQAISVSAMGDTITPCDQNLRPIANSILAFDTRNIQEAKFFETTFGKEWIFQKTGQPVHPTYSITKILWLKEHNPDVFDHANYFLCFEDLITGLLCGEAVFSYSSAARTMALDINDYSWNEEILDLASIDSAKLAQPMASGTMVGQIHEDLAREFRFSENAKIVVGGHDQPCGALGCGLFQDGVAMDSTGTVEVLLVTSDAPILSKEMLQSSICFWPHVIKGEYCACGQILTAGAALRWFRDVLGEKDSIQAAEQNRDAYDVITSKFHDVPSSLLFIPHQEAERRSLLQTQKPLYMAPH
jgi:xylulokinase